MILSEFGIALMVLGVAIFIFGKIFCKKSNKAKNGSIAIGGNNFGTINNFNQNAPDSKSGHSSHMITIIAMLVELTGISVTIWHAMHVAVK